MITEFDPERIEQKNKSFKKHYKTLIESSVEKRVLYRHLLRALEMVIHSDFTIEEAVLATPKGAGFLKSVETEMSLEDSEMQ